MSSAHRSSGPEEPVARSVTGRVLSVLDAFAGQRRLTLSDISRRTGIPLATTHRLVNELLSWGALERGQNRRYQIGLHLWAIAATAPRWPALREVALPFIDDLHEASGRRHVRLVVLDGTQVVLVEQVHARGTAPSGESAGHRYPAEDTGDGVVILAFAPAAAQERYLLGHGQSADLRRVFADVRRTGYAMSRQLTGIVVAAPVRDATGDVVAAVSVVLPTDVPAPRSLAPLVMLTGRAISRAWFSSAGGCPNPEHPGTECSGRAGSERAGVHPPRDE